MGLYGGRRIEAHTNIFFSNGGLDPWASGGVPAPGPTAELKSELMRMAGHHMDLFFSSETDTEELRRVRVSERASIISWIDQAHAQRAEATEAVGLSLEM